MDYRDTAQEAAFRAELRAWFGQNIPPGWRDVIEDPAGRTEFRKQWHRTLHKAGYVAMSWPVEYGGRGLSPIFDAILGEETARADAPPLPGNVNFLGRAMWTHGTEEQKKRFLPMLLTGDAVWCQGFSEPEAGSDIAGLRTRAVLEGDEWVVNGQKMWTSGAHAADWCLLLVRTDPDKPKHKGISCLLTPMNVPGIEARPIYLANGEPETSEVFFDNVRIPRENMLGHRGGGWSIAMTTLAYERGPGDTGFVPKYQATLRRLEELAAERGRLADPAVRPALATAYIKGEALRLTVLEQLSLRVSGQLAGEEGSIAKLLWADAEQSIQHLAIELLGPDVWLGRAPQRLSAYLSSRPVSVYGGSSQIQKNILAQRVLRMPRA
ncbi:acyl-CoA dehydrogenase family protein [Frankia gtarii]|uniref:acyl-CoA dehydrogenase family protein n=1 Tax=Frankia gtarii TaxID=2950102 RepID=UPI0021C08620|nr:acyl-CoA dehydrogenase family protein [Frankia gtarii]